MEISSADNENKWKYRCCCGCFHVSIGAKIIAIVNIFATLIYAFNNGWNTDEGKNIWSIALIYVALNTMVLFGGHIPSLYLPYLFVNKTPQNVGDDYVDIFGKIFKFTKEIGKNNQHEILRNKFGFSGIRKKESGLVLHCTRRKPDCKFVGVYLNSNGCLYTRGKHNHEHIEKNPKPNVGDDYVDYFGKKWPFHSKIGKQHDPNEILRNKFGFSNIVVREKTLNLYCYKRAKKGGECSFSGIYLKSNGCLYARGKHEHKYN